MPKDGISVTPQRPTFSSDTGTTAKGSFELETGLSIDPNDSLSLPTALKYGAGLNTELFLGFSPYSIVERSGDDGEGFGDTLVGMRHRFWADGQGTSTAVQLATKLPTGNEGQGLSSGEIDFTAAAILSHVINEQVAATAYYEFGLLGDPQQNGTDAQHTIAFAASHSLPGHFGVFAELAQISADGGLDPLIATIGATQSFSPTLAFDVGVGLGLNGDAPDVVLLAGFTVNLGLARP